MFTKMIQVVGVAFCLSFAVFMLMTFSSKEYEVHVTSDTLVEDVSYWDIQTILDSKGSNVPAKDWEKVLESRDYILVPVASLQLRKRQSSSEEG